jgi:hypothetical protein
MKGKNQSHARTTPPSPRGELGVDVSVQDGRVVFDQLLGPCTVRSTWEKRDAEIIGGLIVKAAQETGEEVEIVRDSGLVVAKDVPT